MTGSGIDEREGRVGFYGSFRETQRGTDGNDDDAAATATPTTDGQVFLMLLL